MQDCEGSQREEVEASGSEVNKDLVQQECAIVQSWRSVEVRRGRIAS